MPVKTKKVRSPFVQNFLSVQEAVYANARDKGFYDKPREDGTAIALMHSELSEALEGLRKGNPASEHIPEFSSLEEELADTIIRAMDMAAHKGLRLGEAIEAKHAFNKNRTRMHGGKAF
jgi:NTP pyrophosphatase (non-canonical NTP hydrolase)